MKFFRRQETADDSDLSAEEVRQLRRRTLRQRILMLGLPFALLLVVCVIFGIPRLSEWRARQFVAEANRLLTEGKLQEALNNATSAVQMQPQLPVARRAYGAVLLAAGVPEALPVLKDLVASPAAMNQDRLQLAEGGLRFGDLALAEQIAINLLQHGSNTPQALYVLARVRLAQQRPTDALQALTECIEAGGEPQAVILLARLKLASGTPEGVKSATDLLQPLTSRTDKDGLEALLTLVSSPALRSPDGLEWIKALRAHPEATDEQKLLASTAEIQLNPGSYIAVTRRTIEEFRLGSHEQRAQLARWLNQNREHKAVLEIIGPSEAATRSDFFLIRLDAMAGLGDWLEVSKLLRDDGLPLQSPIVLLYRGRAARETGEMQAASTFYRRAIIESANQPDLLWYVIGYLSRVGENEVLEQELGRLTENPATARQAFEALVPLVQKRRDANALRDLYNGMIQRLPADQVVQNDHRYFAALTGHPPDLEGARSLVNAEPRMLAYRITLGLLLLKSGMPGEALDVFNGVTLEPARIQPYQRAILAAILGANGRDKEARELASNVPGDSVTMQEFELIRPWHGQ